MATKSKLKKRQQRKDGKPSDQAMVRAAQRIYGNEGSIEIDDWVPELPKARVSRGDEGGAYVMAWVWVYDHQVEPQER